MPYSENQPAIPAPIGDSRRSAADKLRGYKYQIWLTILRWVKSTPEEDIYIETAEDFDSVSADQIDATQVKHTSASLSLNTEAAMKALSDCWDLRKRNEPRCLVFHYITTGDAAKESNATFTRNRVGLEVWESAKTDDNDLEEIRTYLLRKATELEPGKSCPVPDELVALLKDGTADELREKLIGPVTWQTNAPNMEAVVGQVEDEIFAFSYRINDPLPEEKIGELKRDLFFEAWQVATSNFTRKLVARKFVDLLKKQTLLTLPRAMVTQLQAAQHRPEPEPPSIPVDWKVPSSELEEWPTSVGHNRELERPELETIIKTIGERSHSAHMLVGEAGSGKSALLAKLTKRLAADGMPYLALKADLIDADIQSLESLIPGLAGQSLITAITEAAKKRPFVVLADQLDAVCSITNKKPRRLTLILQLLHALARMDNVHIVASCRRFEFETDPRLEKFRISELRLELPPWEKVAALLKEEDVNPDEIVGASRDILRVPWNLKLFLSLPAPRPLLDSFYDLARKIWDKAVKDADDPQRCGDLVDLIAERIDEEENFLVPESITDGHIKERMRLLSESILLQPAQPSLIGFRHQTYYDYFMLRIFERKRKTLEQYITKHDQSFFIRPTVTRTLAYLRVTNPSTYHEALTTLMAEGRLRRHLRYLVLDFVGKRQDPTDKEIALFQPMLGDEKMGRQFLQAISGSKGWFAALQGTAFETEWMTSTDRAGIASSVLGPAIIFAEDDVVALMATHWLPNAGFDSAALWVLSQTKSWHPGALHLLEKYAARARIDDASWALNQLIRMSAKDAVRSIGILFARKADEIRAEIDTARAAMPPERPPLPTDAEVQAATPAEASAIFDRVFVEDPAIKKSKEVLTADLFHSAGLHQVVAQDCEGFLRETWPKAKEMLALTQDRKSIPQIAYERDGIGIERFTHSDRHESILETTEKALENLARTAPAKFLAWAEAEQSSSSLTVHRLIAAGAVELPTSFADWVISYLMGDMRRLYLGDFRDESEDTRALISKFAPHCSKELLDKLTIKVVDVPTTLLPLAARLYPNTSEDRRLGALRRDRAQLLAVFPQNQMPTPGQTALAADVDEYGPPPGNRPQPRGGFVGAPVRSEEFAGKSEDEVFAILEKYPDDCTRSTTWDINEDISRTGGVLQQADAFAAFTVTDIAMGRSILKRLQPGRHQKYATAILRKWADPMQGNVGGQAPVVSPSELEDLVAELNRIGFTSEDFRAGAAGVLQTVAKTNKGLRSDTLAMLKGWLPEIASPTPDEYAPSERGKDLEHSILYEAGGGWLVPMGRAPVVEAIIMGNLYQDPAKIDETVSFLEELSETERHPAVWAEALIHVTYLFNKRSERMTALVSKLFTTLPDMLAFSQTAHFLSDVTGSVMPPEVEADWIAKLRGRSDPVRELLAGELTILHFARRKTPWSKTLIDGSLSGQNGVQFQRGITYGAATFIGVKTLAPDLEPILAAGLSSPSTEIQNAALTFIRHIDEKTWTLSAKKLVQQVLQSGLRQKGNSEMIASQMESVALVDPEYALSVAEHYAQKMAEDPTRSNAWTWGASHLTSIALTAQRNDETQERGLLLFENLLDMSVQDAKKAAELMNHRESGKV
jgi:hypothetical protein